MALVEPLREAVGLTLVLRLRDSEGVPVGERDSVGLCVRDTEDV